MIEILKQSAEHWNNYWNGSLFLILMAAAAVWLFLFRRKEKYVRYLLGYTAVVLVLYFCPLTAGVIQKCVGSMVYWRVLWLLPAVPVQAAAAAELLRKQKGLKSVLIVAVCLALIAAGGRGFLKEGYFSRVHNYQQVPDTAAGVCELIREDAKDSEVLAASDDYIGSYLRVYDASVKLAYGRRGMGAASKAARRLYRYMNAPVVDCGKAGRLAKKCTVDYLILKIPAEDQKQKLQKYGYEELGVVGAYAVFKGNFDTE